MSNFNHISISDTEQIIALKEAKTRLWKLNEPESKHCLELSGERGMMKVMDDVQKVQEDVR